jgi:hypothetical protein
MEKHIHRPQPSQGREHAFAQALHRVPQAAVDKAVKNDCESKGFRGSLRNSHGWTVSRAGGVDVRESVGLVEQEGSSLLIG